MRGFLGGVSINASVRAFLEWVVLVPASAAACPPYSVSYIITCRQVPFHPRLRAPLKSARQAQLALSPLASLASLPCLFPVLSVCLSAGLSNVLTLT